MKTVLKLLLVSILGLFTFSACAMKQQPTEQMQGTLYTQVNMWTEKNQIIATNYQRGYMIPVNSEVVIVSYSSKEIKFKVVGQEQVISFVNIPKHTNLTIEQLFSKIFAKTKVNMASFSSTAKKAIEAGNLKNGMTKAEVIVARGYPPFIGTPSLDSNIWKFWQNRFVTRDVQFKNGKVSKLVGWGTGNN